MPLTTRETRHTAGTSAYQTFRVTVERRPSDRTYSRPNTRTGLRPSFASMHKGVQNTVPKHRSPQGQARTRARRHRSDSPPLRTLTQTMLEVHTQAFTRCSSTLPLRRCSSMHEWTILHGDESTTPFPCVGDVQSAKRAMLECKRSHARRCSVCTEMRTGGPALCAPLRPCCGWLPLALPEDEAL